MYKQFIQPKNIVKIALAIVAVWLVSTALHSTFSRYVEGDYSTQNVYNVYEINSERDAILTRTLQNPIGLQGFESTYAFADSDPNEIVEIVVQFVTPPSVALRLIQEDGGSSIQPLSEQSFEEEALDAHDVFAEQLQTIMRVQSIMRAHTASTEIFSEHHTLFNGVFMRVPQHMVEQIAELDEVFAVMPNIQFQATIRNQDVPAFANQSDFMRESLEFFNMDYIHNTMGFTGEGISVAVFDTGVDYNHPRLQRYQDPATGRIRGQNFTMDDDGNVDSDDVMDRDGHGTHVSGTIIAMAPDVELWHYKVLDDYGWGDLDWVITGIETAHKDGVDVMNLSVGSLGMRDPINPMNMAVNLAMLDGIVVVTAAGNAHPLLGHEGLFSIASPGDASLPISVGNVYYDGYMNATSLYGPVTHTHHIKPDIVAPGTDVVSTTLGGEYEAMDGTSMAAPHIAGVAALMLENFPNAQPYEIKARIMNTSNPLENLHPNIGIPNPWWNSGAQLPNTYNSVFITGAGLVNPRNALQSEAFATVGHNIPWIENDERTVLEKTMASLSFGFVAGNDESIPLTVTIHNAGANAWSREVIFNGNHDDISLELVNSNTSGADHTYTFQMRFSENAIIGSHEGNLVLTNGDQRLILPFAAWFDRNAREGIVINQGEGLIDFGSNALGFDNLPAFGLGAPLVTINNFDNQPTGEINVTLSGRDRAAFTFFNLPAAAHVQTPFSFTIPNISSNFWEEFQMHAHYSLDVGIYHATLIISGENISTEKINLRFEVEEPTEDIILFSKPGWTNNDLDLGTEVVGFTEIHSRPHLVSTRMDNLGQIALTIEGQNPDAFTVNDTYVDDLEVNMWSHISLSPRAGLAVGKYEATVVARKVGESDILGSFDVHIRVIEPNTRNIELTPNSDHDFGSSIVGFNNHAHNWVEVRNVGDQPTGQLNLAIIGENRDSFRLNAQSISLGMDESAMFVVAPIDGLSEGIHTATVSVSGSNGILEKFDVSITVDAMPTSQELGRIQDVFPDPALAEIIAVLIGDDQTIDTTITQLHLDMITIINGQWAGIQSLEGAQYLRNLRVLNLEYNEISDLSPLSELSELAGMQLASNQIQDLTPLSYLENLRVLGVGDNQISDINPLSNLINLILLELSSNQIYDIAPLSNLVHLRTLWMFDNQINNFSPLQDIYLIDNLGAMEQWVTQYVDWQDPLIAPIIVQDSNGSLVQPYMISNEGIYEDGYIVWSDLDEEIVTYYWYDQMHADNIGSCFGFSGIVTVMQDLDAHTVTFELHGGEGDFPPQTIADGELVTAPELEPTRIGYTFSGWFTTEAGDVEFDFTAPITVNTVIHAQWVQNGTEPTNPTSPTDTYTTSPTGTHATSPTGTHTTSPTGTHTTSPTGTHTTSPTDTHTASPTGTQSTPTTGIQSTTPTGTQSTPTTATQTTSPIGSHHTAPTCPPCPPSLLQPSGSSSGGQHPSEHQCPPCPPDQPVLGSGGSGGSGGSRGSRGSEHPEQSGTSRPQANPTLPQTGVVVGLSILGGSFLLASGLTIASKKKKGARK